MGVDSRGVRRGACCHPGCCCGDFLIGSGTVKCTECNHPPVNHKIRDEECSQVMTQSLKETASSLSSTCPQSAPGGAVGMEVQAGAAQDIECQGEGQGVGQDSRKQDTASSLGQQPDTTRRVTTPQSPSAEDSLSSVKCVDGDRQLSAEIVRQHEEGGEALSNGILEDDNSADTQSSSYAVSDGPRYKLPQRRKRGRSTAKSRKRKKVCNGHNDQMLSMTTPSPVSPNPSTTERSPTSLTVPSQSGEAPTCQYPECSAVCAVDGNGRFLACCEVHHTEQESQLKWLQEHRGVLEGDRSQSRVPSQSGEAPTCQYPECSEVCAVDGDGRVLACCEVHRTEQESQLREYSSAQGSGRGKGRVPSQSGEAPTCQYPECSEVCAVDGNGRVLACCEVHRTEQESQLREYSSVQESGRGKGRAPSQSGEAPTCQYPECSEVCAVDGNGRVLACCEVHHTEQESQLRVFSDALRGGSGVQGSKSVVQGGDRSSRGTDRGHTPQHRPPAPTPTHKICKLPGCQRPCYAERDGHVNDFCGWIHAHQYQVLYAGSRRAVQSQHTDHEQQGISGLIADNIRSTLCSSSSSSNTNSGNHGSEGCRFTEAVASTQLGPAAVSEGSVCRLPCCMKQARVESGEYKGFCSRLHCEVFSRMTQSHASLMSLTGPSQSDGDIPHYSQKGVVHVNVEVRTAPGLMKTLLPVPKPPTAPVPHTTPVSRITAASPASPKALRRARTGVDSRGLDYGACSHPGCLCSGCQSVPGARKCSVCSHPLMRHKAVGSSWKPGVNSDMKIAWTTVTRFRTDITRFARDAAACLVMDNDDEIKQDFLTKWTKNPQNKPQPADIKTVLRIDNPTLKSRFDQYCATLPSPNVEWLYHGTAIKCHILQSQTFCRNRTCGVCGISRDGFDKAKIGTRVSRFKRFGHAFYLAPNSSKCHEYTLGFGNLRALLYCQVALGNPYYATSNMQARQSPPLGYNSVYGKAGTHQRKKGCLNYDEVAIYGVPEAILPRYIVVYQKDSIDNLL